MRAMRLLRRRFGRIGLAAALAGALTLPAVQAAQAPGPSIKLPGLATPQRRVALVIGNARYTGVPELTNSINDSADMCATLRELNFETLCFSDIPTHAEFKRRMEDFRAKLGPGTASLFYYAGHGIEIDGENYLIPTGAQVKRREDVEDETLSMRYVMETLADARSDFNLVILDACRNSPFTQAIGRPLRYRSLTPKNDAPTGSLVLYATAANDQALDGFAGDRNSPFAKHLLAYMRKPGLPVERLIKKVSLAVQAETFRTTGRRQVPYTYGAFTGEFCFAGCTPGPGPDGLDTDEVLPIEPPPLPPPAVVAPAPRPPVPQAVPRYHPQGPVIPASF
jgi:uncharacterized caspase-like protein